MRPYDEVVAAWHRSIGYANDPERLFDRFRHQIDATYAKRIKPPASGQLSWANLRRGAVLGYNVLVEVGLKADYRRGVLACSRVTRCAAGGSMRYCPWASWLII